MLGRLLDPTKGRRRFFRKDFGFGLCLMPEQKKSLKVFGRGEKEWISSNVILAKFGDNLQTKRPPKWPYIVSFHKLVGY